MVPGHKNLALMWQAVYPAQELAHFPYRPSASPVTCYDEHVPFWDWQSVNLTIHDLFIKAMDVRTTDYSFH
jgi:hypothetical protein